MALPRHTFGKTGDPVVDQTNYFQLGMRPVVLFEDWFERNHHILSHTPEKIIREAVPFWDERGPGGHGIYFLVYQDTIAYVGKATSVDDRIQGHHRTGKPFDRYWCFGNMPLDWMSHVEGYYIERCKPYWNLASVPYDPLLDRLAKQHRKMWEVNETTRCDPIESDSYGGVMNRGSDDAARVAGERGAGGPNT